MYTRKIKFWILLICVVSSLFMLIGCEKSNNNENNPTVETDNLKITYNGHAEKDIGVGIDKPHAAGYKFKLKIENKSDKKIEYYVEKLIVDDVTLELHYMDESCKGKLDPNEKKIDDVGILKEKIENADIDIDKIKKIELYLKVGEQDQKTANGKRFELGVSDPNYPLLEAPKIVFEF
ncbi:hypothetical protein [Ruminococcus sp. FC2018]|uniref:hypothetical protein n=1 Tax=Ruminococcus sp. FC2018 TaxID=1410617 RepID=UPI0004917E2D|nr:hypothetical protein [Ruminococcus sp. FC2018]